MKWLARARPPKLRKEFLTVVCLPICRSQVSANLLLRACSLSHTHTHKHFRSLSFTLALSHAPTMDISITIKAKHCLFACLSCFSVCLFVSLSASYCLFVRQSYLTVCLSDSLIWLSVCCLIMKNKMTASDLG